MIISKEQFYQNLKQDNIFIGKTIDLDKEKLVLKNLGRDWLSFENCIINCDSLDFIDIKNSKLTIEFRECTFNCIVNFSNCSINKISFIDTKVIKSLNLKGNTEKSLELNSFSFSMGNFINTLGINIKPKLKTTFNISKTKIKNFAFENIEHIGGSFCFIDNEIGENGQKYSPILFKESSFLNSYFGNNKFYNLTLFENTTFTYDSNYKTLLGFRWNSTTFFQNSFKKISFSNSNFKGKCEFDKCDFLSTTLFAQCKNLDNSELKFVACKFEKYSLFDNSKFNKIEILHSKFQEKASFENLETNYFKIHQVTFAEAAYFDDLNKTNNNVIENWDRKTLRAIKRELVNSHNQIDYLRFKSYELKAYKKEVDQNKLNWKDSLILYFNENSNYFGLDWTKGIRFVFQWSFIFYLLYIISYSTCISNLSYMPKAEDFLVNYLKFTNPLFFLKTPLKNSENYFLPLLFLSLSKIFVSYGIYQTIQAFRKFGVNGG